MSARRWGTMSQSAQANHRRLKRDVIGRNWLTRPEPPATSWWLCQAETFYQEAHAQRQRLCKPLPSLHDFVLSHRAPFGAARLLAYGHGLSGLDDSD